MRVGDTMDEFKTLNRKKTDAIKWDIVKSETIPFSIADADYETAQAIKHALIKRAKHGAFGYTYEGQDYRRIVQSWINDRYHYTVKESWIYPIPRVLNAISLILKLFTNKEDGVVIQTPVYHKFYEVIKNHNRTQCVNPFINENNHYTMDFDQLEVLFKQGAKLLLLSSPHNPLGRVFTHDEVKRIIMLCKQYDVLLVSDEIHADVIMKGYAFVSVGAFFNDYDNIIILSAASKTFNIAGLHIANMIVKNAKLADPIMTAYKRDYLHHQNIFALTALKAAYQYGGEWVDKQNEHIYANYIMLKDALKSTHEHITIAPLEGTFLAWIDLRCYKTDEPTLFNAFKAHNVLPSEGSKFGTNYHGFIRFNLAVSKTQLKQGIDRLVNALHSLKG